MISIPIAVHMPLFHFQLDLFWYNHVLTYGEDEAKLKAHAVVIKRNRPNAAKVEALEWPVAMPHTMCEAFFDYGTKPAWLGERTPLNIQAGLMQVLDHFDDDQVIEVMDCDMFHFRPPLDMIVPDDVLWVSDIYEKWHMHTINGPGRSIIVPYIKQMVPRFYNGGFVPLIGRVRTFRKFVGEWAAVHEAMLRTKVENKLTHWWAGMYSLQVACQNNRVLMLHWDSCYVPNVNNMTDEQHSCHYSCDPYFSKQRFPRTDIQRAPDDPAHRRMKDWDALRKSENRNWGL